MFHCSVEKFCYCFLFKRQAVNSSDAFKKKQNSKGVARAGKKSLFFWTFLGRGEIIDKAEIYKCEKMYILQLVLHGHLFYTNYLYVGIDTYILYKCMCTPAVYAKGVSEF